MSRPTLVSLAQELGVSRQTVSNVINAPHLVRAETRERVAAAIEASGYRPNVAAQALRNQRSMTVALRIDDTLDTGINGAVMDRFLHALVTSMRERGYSLLLITASSTRDESATLREMSTRGTIDGCVLSGTHFDDPRPAELAAAGLPFVAFGRPWGDDDAQHPWVDVDGLAGTRTATRHLLDRGLERIGFLGWPEGSAAGDDRRAGWAEAMREAGHDELPDLTESCLDRMVDGMGGMQRLMERGVEAVVCASDSLAIGAATALVREGLPTELDGTGRVIGFDNTPVARALGISSLDQPVEQAADNLAAMLEQLMAPGAGEQELPGRHELLQPELVARTGSPLLGS